jgi:hypothetical protein
MQWKLWTAMTLCAVSAAVQAGQPLGWGGGPTQPVEVCKPPGQRAYLQRLQCADGSVLSWQRSGSVGLRNPLPEGLSAAQVDAMLARDLAGQPLASGEVDHHMIDRYQLDCGGQLSALYMDMYHCDAAPPQRAPAGFTLQP